MSIRFDRILFPTDFSSLAAVALDHARDLCERFNSELHCLHIVDEAYQYWSAMGPESIPVGPPPTEMVEVGRQRMADFQAARLTDLKRPVITDVVLGRPFSEIIGYARDHNIDLIVMGTHGHGAIAHMLLGSTTEKVVRKASCAVLTVRAKGHDFVMP